MGRNRKAVAGVAVGETSTAGAADPNREPRWRENDNQRGSNVTAVRRWLDDGDTASGGVSEKETVAERETTKRQPLQLLICAETALPGAGMDRGGDKDVQ